MGSHESDPGSFRARQIDRKGRHNLAGDLVLHVEDGVGRAVVTLRPELSAGDGVYQLGVDPHLAVALAHAALKEVSDAKFAPDAIQVYRLAFVSKARVLGDYEQSGNPGQIGDDVLGDAVAQILLFRIAADVLERQDGDGRLVGQRRCVR